MDIPLVAGTCSPLGGEVMSESTTPKSPFEEAMEDLRSSPLTDSAVPTPRFCSSSEGAIETVG